MKIITVLLVAILALSPFVMVDAVCRRACTREYNPICAALKLRGKYIKCTFANKCGLQLRRCQRPDEDWQLHHLGACKPQSEGCDMWTTP